MRLSSDPAVHRRPIVVHILIFVHFGGLVTLSFLAPNGGLRPNWILGYLIEIAIISGVWRGLRAAWTADFLFSSLLVVAGMLNWGSLLGTGQVVLGVFRVALLVHPSVRAWCRGTVSSHSA